MRCGFGVIFAGVVLAAGLAACRSPGSAHPGGAGSLPAQADSLALAAGLSTGEAAAARQLCLDKCLRCHKFYDPAGYEAEEWHFWMRKMSKKARLTSEQESLVNRYLAAFRPEAKNNPHPENGNSSGPIPPVR